MASAQESDEAARGAARKLGYQGVAAFQAGEYAAASEQLNKAYRILHAPSLGLWSARSFEKSGKLVEAAERYREVTLSHTSSFDTHVQAQAVADAQSELTLLEPRIPYVTVQLSGAEPGDVALTIDDVAVSSELIGVARPVNPGVHRVVAVRREERVELSITCTEGGQSLAPLAFKSLPASAPVAPPPLPAAEPARAAVEPAPTPPPAARPAPQPALDGTSEPRGGAQRVAAWVALGLGGAAATAGGLLGVGAILQRRKLDDRRDCDGSACDTSAQSTVHDYNQLRTLSAVALWTGGGLLTTGIVLLATAPSTKRASVALQLTPSGAAFKGLF